MLARISTGGTTELFAEPHGGTQPAGSNPSLIPARSHTTLNLGPNGGYRGTVLRLSLILGMLSGYFPTLLVLPPLLSMSFLGAKAVVNSGTALNPEKSFNNGVRFKGGSTVRLHVFFRP